MVLEGKYVDVRDQLVGSVEVDSGRDYSTVSSSALALVQYLDGCELSLEQSDCVVSFDGICRTLGTV